ncbi:transmembrane protein 234 homolog [Periplaneta americana]|uniref:transmembrane protein 234 homolog n=1 Tax=Periplaneta americana TaxID=6978 RepID=UPI0037E91497
MLGEITSLIAVGVLWGATNPFIRKGSAGVEKVKASHSSLQLFYEVKYLVYRWQYVIPFILNQCGSVLYYIALGTSDLTLAVPVANSLTFVATAICGWAIGEELPQRNTYLGILLVLCGIVLCCVDKTYSHAAT